MENKQLSVQERLNMAVSALETQRKINADLENEKNEIQNQLNSTNQGLLQIIQSNIDLKEQVQALVIENNEMIEVIQNYEKKNHELELVSEIGNHLVEAVNKINQLNNINRK